VTVLACQMCSSSSKCTGVRQQGVCLVGVVISMPGSFLWQVPVLTELEYTWEFGHVWCSHSWVANVTVLDTDRLVPVKELGFDCVTRHSRHAKAACKLISFMSLPAQHDMPALQPHWHWHYV
jgi:hypothetical protein